MWGSLKVRGKRRSSLWDNEGMAVLGGRCWGELEGGWWWCVRRWGTRHRALIERFKFRETGSGLSSVEAAPILRHVRCEECEEDGFCLATRLPWCRGYSSPAFDWMCAQYWTCYWIHRLLNSGCASVGIKRVLGLKNILHNRNASLSL